MLEFSLVIVICLCFVPLMAALNIEIEKKERKQAKRPPGSPKPEKGA